MLKYLALGDSYTIGEQVVWENNFPNRTREILREKYHIEAAPPEIIAVTGWTTDELMTAINEKQPAGDFDIVTLLIGVNNQYRGRSVENYKEEFTALLTKAISFAKGDAGHVFVLSIPDWGVTPFAEGKDKNVIATEIDEYNIANKAITLARHCDYLDITFSTREHGSDESHLTEDKLHYSAKEYIIWAELLAEMIAEKCKTKAR